MSRRSGYTKTEHVKLARRERAAAFKATSAYGQLTTPEAKLNYVLRGLDSGTIPGKANKQRTRLEDKIVSETKPVKGQPKAQKNKS